MTEDDLRSLLREMKDEPVPADSLARIRIGVAAATTPRRGFWWRFFAAVAVASAVVIAVLFLRPTRQIAPTAPPVAAKVVQPDIEPKPVVKAAAVKPRVRRPARQIDPQPVNGGDVVVRIETPDPDVVILLLGD